MKKLLFASAAVLFLSASVFAEGGDKGKKKKKCAKAKTCCKAKATASACHGAKAATTAKL